MAVVSGPPISSPPCHHHANNIYETTPCISLYQVISRISKNAMSKECHHWWSLIQTDSSTQLSSLHLAVCRARCLRYDIITSSRTDRQTVPCLLLAQLWLVNKYPGYQYVVKLWSKLVLGRSSQPVAATRTCGWTARYMHPGKCGATSRYHIAQRTYSFIIV